MTVFVTGAGSGIGLHLARLALERGDRVAGFDLRIADDVGSELRDRARSADRVWLRDAVDVRDTSAVASAFDDAVAQIGSPTLVINSAGISTNDLFAASSAEDFERTVAVNLFGSRNVAAAALPHLRRGSRLALIASLAGITGGYTYAAYAASKAGVIGLARVLRLEWAPDGIGVSVRCSSLAL